MNRTLGEIAFTPIPEEDDAGYLLEEEAQLKVLALEAAHQLHGRFEDPAQAVEYARTLLAFLKEKAPQ